MQNSKFTDEAVSKVSHVPNASWLCPLEEILLTNNLLNDVQLRPKHFPVAGYLGSSNSGFVVQPGCLYKYKFSMESLYTSSQGVHKLAPPHESNIDITWFPGDTLSHVDFSPLSPFFLKEKLTEKIFK